MRTSLRVVSAVFAIGALLISAVVVVGGGEKPLPTNPDAGLTEQQVLQRQDQSRSAFQAKLTEWYQTLTVSSLDLGNAPHGERAVYLKVPASFKEAVAAASIVVTGTVLRIAPGENGTLVELSVQSALKGSAPSSIAFTQSSTVRPTADWKGIIIADTPGTGLLLPGTEGEFLLQESPTGLVLQEGTGSYTFTSGKVSIAASNPFYSQLNGVDSDYLLGLTTTVNG